MPTLATELARARAQLLPVAGDLAALEARLLVAHAHGLSAEALVMSPRQAVTEDSLSPLLARRLRHEPLAQILGIRAFWRDEFLVNRDVLCPRPDSETLIEALLSHRPQRAQVRHVLDLGTGSGCLLLSALREYPEASGVGVDRSQAALCVARANAHRLGLSARARWVAGRWAAPLAIAADVVLMNPPYIPTADLASLETQVREYEPHLALDGGADGLQAYRVIIPQLPSVLAPGAWVLAEVGQGQATDVAALAQAQGAQDIQFHRDLAGIARVVAFSFTR